MSFILWPFLPSIATQRLCSQATIIFFLKTNNKTEIQVRSIVRIIIFPPKRSTELKQILQRSTLSLFGFCLFLLFLFANHLRKVLTTNINISFQHHLDSTLQKGKHQILQVTAQLCKILFKIHEWCLYFSAFNFNCFYCSGLWD